MDLDRLRVVCGSSQVGFRVVLGSSASGLLDKCSASHVWNVVRQACGSFWVLTNVKAWDVVAQESLKSSIGRVLGFRQGFGRLQDRC